MVDVDQLMPEPVGEVWQQLRASLVPGVGPLGLGRRGGAGSDASRGRLAARVSLSEARVALLSFGLPPSDDADAPRWLALDSARVSFCRPRPLPGGLPSLTPFAEKPGRGGANSAVSAATAVDGRDDSAKEDSRAFPECLS